MLPIFEADRVERAHRGFAARSRALDAHFDVLHAAFLRRAAARSAATCAANGVDLREPLKPALPEVAQRQRVALAVGDGDDGVVERRVDVRDALGDVLLDLLARARGSGLLQLLARRCVSVAMIYARLPGLDVEFDRGLARTLARPRVGARALAAHRQALAVARAAVAVRGRSGA